MRRLSLLGSTSIHKTDVFETLDDNDSWSASLGGGSSGGGFVKPQIERIGDNDEEWFSEAEQRVSGEEDSNHSKSPLANQRKHHQPTRQGSVKGKKQLLLPERQPSREDAFLIESQFDLPSAGATFAANVRLALFEESKPTNSRSASPSKKKKEELTSRTVPEASTSSSCLQFDFTKAKTMPSGTAVPMDAFLSEFETTENDQTDREESKRSHRDRKKKLSKDDPKRQQRRSERARKMEEDYSESESDYNDTSTTARGRPSRKTSMLGELTEEELDVFEYSENGKAVSRSASLRQPPQKRSSSSKKSSVRRSASEAVKPNTTESTRSSKMKSAGDGKPDKKKEITRLAPAKKDCQSDASLRRSRIRKPPTSPTSEHRPQGRGDDSDGTDDSDSRQRRAIPAQYQVKNNIGSNGGQHHNHKTSPSKEKRRQSIAPTKPEDVVNAIRRRYSVSSAVYNTDTETDDQSIMTDSSETSRRSHRRSRDVWREKEKFKQQADTKFDASTIEQKNQNEKEMIRQQILDQSRRGPIRSLSRRSMQDAERSESTRLLGQLLGEPDENNSASDNEKSGRIRRQSLELGYGQDSVYGSIDQLDKRGNNGASYLPSGLNHAGRRGSQTCDRRGSQTGGDSATDSMRNLMQTLEGATKVADSKQKMIKKKGKCNSPEQKSTKDQSSSAAKDQSGAAKDQSGATSYDKSIDEILKARRLRGAKGRQKSIQDKTEETKKFNAMNLLTAGMLFK